MGSSLTTSHLYLLSTYLPPRIVHVPIIPITRSHLHLHHTYLAPTSSGVWPPLLVLWGRFATTYFHLLAYPTLYLPDYTRIIKHSIYPPPTPLITPSPLLYLSNTPIHLLSSSMDRISPHTRIICTHLHPISLLTPYTSPHHPPTPSHDHDPSHLAKHLSKLSHPHTLSSQQHIQDLRTCRRYLPW